MRTQKISIDFDAALFDGIHHIEHQDHRHAHFYQLRGQI